MLLAVIEKADMDEIELVFEGLKLVEPVYEDKVDGKAHRSHMFTVYKFLANKFLTFIPKVVPTVTVHSIFVCLATAAIKQDD